MLLKEHCCQTKEIKSLKNWKERCLRKDDRQPEKLAAHTQTFSPLNLSQRQCTNNNTSNSSCSLSRTNKQCHHILRAYAHTWLFFIVSLYLHLPHKNDSSILALPYHFGLVHWAHKKLETFHFSTHYLSIHESPRRTLVDHSHHGNSVLRQVGTHSCSACLEATLTITWPYPEPPWTHMITYNGARTCAMASLSFCCSLLTLSWANSAHCYRCDVSVTQENGTWKQFLNFCEKVCVTCKVKLLHC